jgi:O-phosphoseryl-tRNA(Cys) synthetase
MFDSWVWIATAGVLIPIAGVVFGVGYSLAARYMRHRERMAMLEHGVDPPD